MVRILSCSRMHIYFSQHPVYRWIAQFEHSQFIKEHEREFKKKKEYKHEPKQEQKPSGQ